VQSAFDAASGLSTPPLFLDWLDGSFAYAFKFFSGELLPRGKHLQIAGKQTLRRGP
jgi:hypothetical protein